MKLEGLEPPIFGSGIRRATNYAIASLTVCIVLYDNNMHRPGIEPGPRAWKARILTIELSTL